MGVRNSNASGSGSGPEKKECFETSTRLIVQGMSTKEFRKGEREYIHSVTEP